jgi:hypothetical protein
VELHWGLVAGCDDRRSPENLDWFWSQTEPAAVDIEQSPQIELPKTFFHLTPNAHLLYLVAHLMLQHGGARLLWYYDIHLFVANNRHLLNWEEISTHACELGWFASLQAALAGVNERFRTSLPDDMRPSNEVKRGLSQPRGGDKPYDEAAWDEVMGLSWPARVHYLWDNFFPSTTYIQWRYQPRPKWLWPLCYLFRWSVFRAGALKLATRRVTKRKW